jgi:periplasmic protein TonB
MNAILGSAPAPSARPTPEGARFVFLDAAAAPRTRARWTTLVVSLVTHSLLIGTIIAIPLLSEEPLPTSAAGIKAFFAVPADMTPPPPPPPPPAVVAAAPRVAVATPLPHESTFVAPIEVPNVIPVEETAPDLGVEGGMAGGVEGGIAGGVVGGVIGGLSAATPPPAIVRIGGQIKAPKLLRRVDPVYPVLARQTRITGRVFLRAIVDVTGAVREVHVESGPPLLCEAAAEAVRQWRYQPLLLNGVPRAFDLEVMVSFGLVS